MKKIALALLLLLSGTVLFAQRNGDSRENRPMHSVNLSLLGDASMISVNYQKLYQVRPNFLVSGKLGLGYNQEFQLCLFGPCSTPPENFLTIPHHITGNWGGGWSFFEVGLGGTLVLGPISQNYLLYPMIGYRLQPLKSDRLNFRIFGHFPVTGIESNYILFIPIGFSAGFCF